jgi:hypothetical protein
MAIGTDRGPIGIIGINEENLRRLKAGMPLDIDVKRITPPGTRMNRVVIHYAHTYEQVVDDMEAGGLPTNAALRSEAQRLDKQLKAERQG